MNPTGCPIRQRAARLGGGIPSAPAPGLRLRYTGPRGTQAYLGFKSPALIVIGEVTAREDTAVAALAQETAR